MLRVTRSMGLYSSAVGRKEASAATPSQVPSPSPPQGQHCVPRGKEGRPAAQSPHGALGKCLGSVLHGASRARPPRCCRSSTSRGLMRRPHTLLHQGRRKHSRAGAWSRGRAQRWQLPDEHLYLQAAPEGSTSTGCLRGPRRGEKPGRLLPVAHPTQCSAPATAPRQQHLSLACDRARWRHQRGHHVLLPCAATAHGWESQSGRHEHRSARTAGRPHHDCASTAPARRRTSPAAMREPAPQACCVVAVERKRHSSLPAASSYFSFSFGSAMGPVPALPSLGSATHGTPCIPPPQPALGAEGTQAAPAAAKPPSTETAGDKASSRLRCPVFPPCPP